MTAVSKLACASLLVLGLSVSAAEAAPPEMTPAAVSRGADYVSPPSVPERFFLDARTRPLVPDWKPGDPIREIPRQFHGEEDLQRFPPAPANPVTSRIDILTELQRHTTPTGGGGFVTPLVNSDGASFTGVFPPDPTGDVGGGFFVHVYNGSGGAIVKIYNTADGSVAAGPFNMDGLGSGGPCAQGLGDGIVVFDQLANRWLLTEFSGVSNTLCTYLSDGDNPVTAIWTRYTFNTPGFPDYPKYGVWPDAYYVGVNQGPAAYALDRQSMLGNLPATLQRVSVPPLSGLGFQMLPPASVFGATPPPAGAPGIFIRDNDDERNDPGSNDPNNDFLELFTLSVDWSNPANTTLSGPVEIAEDEFNSEFTITDGGFGAIHQPGTSQTLDPLLEVPMVPIHYRNFGTYEVLTANHVTRLADDTTNNIAGIRWFELRRTGGAANPWVLYQQGTYAPTDTGGQISRWMAALGMDESGNIAMGYAAARDPGVFPGVRYVGREATDPLGVMTTPETTIVDGASSQTSADRWGDYFGMGVDPDDGCTFWLSGMYMPAGGDWRTRFASFRFDSCGTPTFTTTANNLSQSVCASSPVALDPITINVNARNGFSDPVTMSFSPALPAGFSGSYTVNPVTPPGTTEADISVDDTATPGASSFLLRGSADGIDRDLELDVNVSTMIPQATFLTFPADGATNVSGQPTFTWTAEQQVESYLIEIATDANFDNVILSQAVTGAPSFTPTATLPLNTQLWWRVSTTNDCGSGVSAVSSFTTQPGPGQCGAGTTTSTVFTDDVESGTNGWTHGAPAGDIDNWTRGSAAHDGSFAWQANNPPNGTANEEWLISPSIALPTGLDGLNLQFWNQQSLKHNGGGGCYDGAILEISTDGGGTWNEMPNSTMLTLPYDGAISSDFGNPLGGDDAWCGDPRAYVNSIVDLSAYAGETVQFRFTIGNDHLVHRSNPALAIDDISVQGCSSGTVLDRIFADGFDGTP